MTTQASADILVMEHHADYDGEFGGAQHQPLRHRASRPGDERGDARAARVAALARAVRNGTYDTPARAKLGAEAFCDALFGGRARP